MPRTDEQWDMRWRRQEEADSLAQHLDSWIIHNGKIDWNGLLPCAFLFPMLEAGAQSLLKEVPIPMLGSMLVIGLAFHWGWLSALRHARESAKNMFANDDEWLTSASKLSRQSHMSVRPQNPQ